MKCLAEQKYREITFQKMFPYSKERLLKFCYSKIVLYFFYIMKSINEQEIRLHKHLIHVKCVKMVEEQVIFLKCVIKLLDVVF